jgi:hypothetical protein
MWKGAIVAQSDALSLNLLGQLRETMACLSRGLSTGRDLNPEPSSYEAAVLYRLNVLQICAKAVVAHFKVLDRDYSGGLEKGLRHDSHVHVCSKTTSAQCCLNHCCTFVSRIV